MKTEFLTPKDGAKFSPAEKHLATLLKSLKSFYTDKESFYKHFMVKVDEKAFTKSETERIWNALHNIAYWDNDAQKHVTPMTSNHKLFFPYKCYSNYSNFFEDYAKQILEEGNIVQQRGRVKGKIYPDTLTHLNDMRAAKAAKKAGIVPEDIFHVEPHKEEQKPASNLFDGLSLIELEQAQTELAAAIQNRREEILGLYKSLRSQIEDLERQVSDLEAKNPWLKQLWDANSWKSWRRPISALPPQISSCCWMRCPTSSNSSKISSKGSLKTSFIRMILMNPGGIDKTRPFFTKL